MARGAPCVPRGSSPPRGAGGGGVWSLRTPVGDNDCNDEAVDTKHSRHDDRDDGLHDEVGLHDAHRRHANPTLRSAVGRAQVCNHGEHGAGISSGGDLRKVGLV